jgi:hypothetical protein
MLLESSWFQWIVEQELSEYLCANPSSGLSERCNHEVLYGFHQVIQIRTYKPAVHYGPEAVEHICLR